MAQILVDAGATLDLEREVGCRCWFRYVQTLNVLYLVQ